MLEVTPGLSFRGLLARGFPDGFDGNIQIGRSPPLSSDKTTHFNLLQKNTGVAFNKMLFFDDCGWSDNCAVVERCEYNRRAFLSFFDASGSSLPSLGSMCLRLGVC